MKSCPEGVLQRTAPDLRWFHLNEVLRAFIYQISENDYRNYYNKKIAGTPEPLDGMRNMECVLDYVCDCCFKIQDLLANFIYEKDITPEMQALISDIEKKTTALVAKNMTIQLGQNLESLPIVDIILNNNRNDGRFKLLNEIKEIVNDKLKLLDMHLKWKRSNQ